MELWGIVVLIVFAAALLAARALRVGERIGLRPLAALDALRQQVSRAVESGGAVHMSLGTGGVGSAETLVSLAGATVLNRLANQAAAANVPPTVTVCDATLLPVAQDSLRRAYTALDRPEQYDPARVLMLTPHPEAYAAAAMGVAQDSTTAGNVFVGSFGLEAALLTEAAARGGMPQVAGAVEPTAQAVMYPTADYLLYGEEVFTTDAYLAEQRSAAGRLVAQDVVRVLVVGAIVLLALLRTLGFV